MTFLSLDWLINSITFSALYKRWINSYKLRGNNNLNIVGWSLDVNINLIINGYINILPIVSKSWALKCSSADLPANIFIYYFHTFKIQWLDRITWHMGTGWTCICVLTVRLISVMPLLQKIKPVRSLSLHNPQYFWSGAGRALFSSNARLQHV